MDRRNITIPADMEHLSAVRAFVGGVAQEAGLPDKSVFRCQLAIDEACTNVIEHGSSTLGLDRWMKITCWVESGQFYIMLIDNSPPFNPLDYPEPDVNAPINERPTGGLGIYFIKRVMDEVHYERGAGENILTLAMQVHPMTGSQDSKT